MAGTIRLGTAGWVFEPWRQSFYPKGLPQKQELSYAAARLGNIEINATFYSHQKAASFANWASQTPENFVFTVKGHQLVTHLKKLKDVEIPLANFFASGVMALGSRLGAFCWQLPSNLGYDEARLEAFLSLLPKTPEALVALAGQGRRPAEGAAFSGGHRHQPRAPRDRGAKHRLCNAGFHRPVAPPQRGAGGGRHRRLALSRPDRRLRLPAASRRTGQGKLFGRGARGARRLAEGAGRGRCAGWPLHCRPRGNARSARCAWLSSFPPTRNMPPTTPGR